ncbi:hypothetical protein Pst134EA_007221 [Puccinia striiformis f. sp. tritici]|nr:hypothetical protein Pst134EA_007221 [Puccinia striiformis f. sp. tritici]KAH9469950.1 hypothetical protein Pst134EA_007221 [Puccinia striiformis f. sp. tritici]
MPDPIRSGSNAAQKHTDGDSLGTGKFRVGSGKFRVGSGKFRVGSGKFRVGTEVRLRNQSGSKNSNSSPLDGRLVAIAEEKDPESFCYGEDCFVIELKDNTMISELVDSLHVQSKWLVKVDGQYVDAPKSRQIFFSQQRRSEVEVNIRAW